MIDKKTFGSFVKEKRTEKNYSQKDLADLLCAYTFMPTLTFFFPQR